MSRAITGRFLCFGLGALYTAGAVPLFSFGATGKHLWSLFEQQVAAVAATFGIDPWLATTLIGLLTVGGPLALVWLLAGPGVKRVWWMLLGAAAYGVFWLFGPT